MQLSGDRHLGYCTNIHPAESWGDTFAQLKKHIPAIKQEVAPEQRFGIGLRLSARAANELDSASISEFRRWLDVSDCYVFTINGFPYGDFHDTRVKDNVYRPDWSTPERLDYTNRLFDLLAELLPDDISEGSVSTLPGSFKGFNMSSDAVRALRRNLTNCVRHIAELVDRTGKDLHLGLEPEPLGLFETTSETIEFFAALHDSHGDWMQPFIGVNYDTCHLAVEFEEAQTSLSQITEAGIRLSKMHLSSALKVDPRNGNWQALRSFADDTYLHQVIIREGKRLRRTKDLPEALAEAENNTELGDEWRVHFHIPLSDEPEAPLCSTRDHLLGALKWLAENPKACRHLEMETYTWGVLPRELQRPNVDEQLVAEYRWTLDALGVNR